MSLYSDLEGIFEYLLSIRRLKTYLSFDIQLPSNWKIPKKYATEDKVVELDSKEPNKRSFSFVAQFNDGDVDLTVQNIRNIIIYNKQIEMKQDLLQQKIGELKRIFETTDLDHLQSLKFDILEEKLDDGEEIINPSGERD